MERFAADVRQGCRMARTPEPRNGRRGAVSSDHGGGMAELLHCRTPRALATTDERGEADESGRRAHCTMGSMTTVQHLPARLCGPPRFPGF